MHGTHAYMPCTPFMHAPSVSADGYTSEVGVGEAKWFVGLTRAIAFKGTRCEDLDLMGELPDSPSFDEVLSMHSTT